MKDVIIETLIDSFKLLPFLFFTFLLIEYFEHKLSKKNKKIITSSGKFGPLMGSFLGIIPQCGFSVAATNLYVTRIISLGTLFSVYLSTSDEMIPILIAEHASIMLFIKIILIKFIIGFSVGFMIDIILRNKNFNKDYNICLDDHSHDSKFIISSLKHTFSIFLFILICNFLINLIMEYGGMHYLESILLKNNIFAPLLTSLIGLIPNCVSSVLLTELFLKGAISFGSLIGGLLSGAGVAILVLFKVNKNKFDSLKILGLLYALGAIFGILIEFISRVI